LPKRDGAVQSIELAFEERDPRGIGPLGLEGAQILLACPQIALGLSALDLALRPGQHAASEGGTGQWAARAAREAELRRKELDRTLGLAAHPALGIVELLLDDPLLRPHILGQAG
jgi:hypothetical protein